MYAASAFAALPVPITATPMSFPLSMQINDQGAQKVHSDPGRIARPALAVRRTGKENRLMPPARPPDARVASPGWSAHRNRYFATAVTAGRAVASAVGAVSC